MATVAERIRERRHASPTNANLSILARWLPRWTDPTGRSLDASQGFAPLLKKGDSAAGDRARDDNRDDNKTYYGISHKAQGSTLIHERGNYLSAEARSS